MTSIKYLGKYFLWHIKTDPKSFICLDKDIGVREKLRDGAAMGWTRRAARSQSSQILPVIVIWVMIHKARLVSVA